MKNRVLSIMAILASVVVIGLATYSYGEECTFQVSRRPSICTTIR